MKSLILIFLLSIFCMAQYDYSGWGDTVSIVESLDSATVRYTDWIPGLNRYSEVWVIAACDDTANAGFASDEINYEFGFQVGTFTMDSNTVEYAQIDTSSEKVLITIDTMTVDSFGVSNHTGYIDDEGNIVVNNRGAIDTSEVPGYATMYRYFEKPKGHLIRFWAIGLGGAQSSDSVVCKFNFQGAKL